MKLSRYIYIVVLLLVACMSAYAQADRKDVRRGNRDFRKENFREAEIDYMKALVKDSMSVAANYNLASSLYRQGDMEQAAKVLDRVKEVAPATASSADYWYNRGDVALEMKDYQTAVDAFAKSLIVRPDDLDAKENFIYAKKMLQNQQNQNQNQNQNQDQQDNQDNKDNQNQDKNQDQNDQDDQDKNDQGQGDQDKNGQDDKDRSQQGQQPKISPQAAQQMLQAIQAKEKETQEKVKEEKAKALKSRQREKNW